MLYYVVIKAIYRTDTTVITKASHSATSEQTVNVIHISEKATDNKK
jgi:hypothetical protein